MKVAIIEAFLAGDSIPEWLLSFTPTKAGAMQPEMTFAQDCTLIEVDGRYILIGASTGSDAEADYISIMNGGSGRVSAASLPVVLPLSFTKFNVAGDKKAAYEIP